MALDPWATAIQAALDIFFFFSFVPHLIAKWIRNASNERHMKNVPIKVKLWEKERREK